MLRGIVVIMGANMQSVTLQNWASAIAAELFDINDDKETDFSLDSFPVIETAVETRGIILKKRFHDYGAHRLDCLQWFAHKKTYQNLACYILSALFHQKTCKIMCANEESEIKNIVIDAEYVWNIQDTSGAQVKLSEYSYWPDEISPRLNLNQNLPAYCYPSFGLSNLDDCVVTDEQRQSRDTVYGFGTLQGILNFVEALLHLSRPSNEINEYALEAEGGFRGVAPLSAEAKLWLPGSVGWFEGWFDRPQS